MERESTCEQDLREESPTQTTFDVLRQIPLNPRSSLDFPCAGDLLFFSHSVLAPFSWRLLPIDRLWSSLKYFCLPLFLSKVYYSWRLPLLLCGLPAFEFFWKLERLFYFNPPKDAPISFGLDSPVRSADLIRVEPLVCFPLRLLLRQCLFDEN